MNKSIFITFFITIFICYGSPLRANNLMLITIPKSGTHLLHKCLHLIDSKNLPYGYSNDLPFEKWYHMYKEKNTLPPPNHWKGQFHPSTIDETILTIQKSYSTKRQHYSSHTYYTKHYNDFLDEKKFKKILLIRDPRAIIVSYANMVKDGFEPEHKTDFEALMLDLIDGRQKNYISWASYKNTAYPAIWEMGMCRFYELYLPFMNTTDCLCVKFENLVGSEGGGSYTAQKTEIKKILNHLNITIPDNKIDKVIHHLFGDSSTFYTGQIDGWKKYFTPTIKEAFKAVPGANELLVALGYEKNATW